MRPRTPQEIAKDLVTTTASEKYHEDDEYLVEYLDIRVCGVDVKRMRYSSRYDTLAADAFVAELKSALARTLEEIGPELAAALAERGGRS